MKQEIQTVKNEQKNMRAIGARVRRLRNNLEMTQYAFGTVIGISSGYLSAIERGERNLPPATAIEINRVTGATLDYIYLGTSALDVVYSDYLMEPNHTRDVTYQRIIVALRTCTQKELCTAYELISCYLRSERKGYYQNTNETQKDAKDGKRKK